MTKIIILDKHPFSDSRIERHIHFLIHSNYQVFSIHYNRYDPFLKGGPCSRAGELCVRINIFPHSLKIPRSLYYNCYIISSHILHDTLSALNFMRFNTTCEPTIIHVHDPTLLLLAKKLSKILQAKIVYDRHELFDVPPEKILGIGLLPRFEGLFELLSRSSIAGVITVSYEHRTQSETRFPHAIVLTVPNFPEDSDYTHSIINTKIQNFCENSMIRMIYIGSLDNNFDRDISLLLKVCERILPEFQKCEVFIGGETHDQVILKKFNFLSNNYPDRFHYMGFIKRPKISEISEQAHIGFFLIKPDSAYWVKCSPNKVFEYLICGMIPVIRADCDYLDDLKTCGLIFKRDAAEEEIVEKIRALLGDPGTMKKMMRDSKNISRKFSFSAVNERYTMMYDMLIR